MRKLLSLALLSLLLGAALAGCTTGDGDGAPTTTTGTPTTTTPTRATPTPATTTPAVPTPPVSQAGVTRVLVVSAPERVAAGEQAQVCWRVEGNGTIGHTAVHFDDESHPDAAAFAVYAGGAAYPDNGPATVTGSFQLPGTFCALLPPANGTTYLRAHAMPSAAQAPGTLSATETVVSVGEPTGIAFSNDLPEVAPAGANATVCWQVYGGSGTVGHTAVHFDHESHPNATAFTDYAAGALYPDNGPATTSGSFQLPGPFCANLTMPQSGAVYMRAHVIQDGGHSLSIERNVVVAPRVNVVGSVPATAGAGESVEVCWRVEGSGTVGHTAIHFDDESHPDATAFTVYDGGAVYPGNGPATTSGSFRLPGPFCANLTMPQSGTVHFRAHAIVAGPPGELGEEHAIRVEA